MIGTGLTDGVGVFARSEKNRLRSSPSARLSVRPWDDAPKQLFLTGEDSPRDNMQTSSHGGATDRCSSRRPSSASVRPTDRPTVACTAQLRTRASRRRSHLSGVRPRDEVCPSRRTARMKLHFTTRRVFFSSGDFSQLFAARRIAFLHPLRCGPPSLTAFRLFLSADRARGSKNVEAPLVQSPPAAASLTI